MFRNYLVTALRSLNRNRLYAAISILGLAVAFTAAILIGQFVRNEFSYDRWIPGYKHIYKITRLLQEPGRPPTLIDLTYAPLKARLEAEFPRRAVVTRLIEDFPAVRRRPGATSETERSFAWVDPNFFEVFPLPSLVGDLQSALQQPDTVVITRSLARKYFGRDLPVGGALEVQGTDQRFHTLRVTAILKDLPSNTNLTTEMFGSGRSAYSAQTYLDGRPWGSGGGFTFVRLSPTASVSDLQRALDVAGRPELALATASDHATKLSFGLMPLTEAHLTSPNFTAPVVKPAGSRSVAYGMAGVGGLIVLVAGINFVTLITARATRRAMEVGVRKAAGARRSDLMIQFMGEALVQVVLSMLIAASLAEILVGPFNALSQRGIALDFIHDPLLLVGIVIVGLCVGLLASIYPALVLSSFRPAAVLKGGIIQAAGSTTARHTLVVVQFAILVALTVTTATVYRQTEFALAKGVGTVDARRVISVFSCDKAFANEVRKLPGVGSAACSSAEALNLPAWKGGTAVQVPGGRRINFASMMVDFGFFELYGVHPVAGRLFSPKYGQDAFKYDYSGEAGPPVVINEAGARALGFADPRKAVGQRFIAYYPRKAGAEPAPASSEIVGVVPDMPATVRAATDPTYYYIVPDLLSVLSIRITGRDSAGTVKAIEAVWRLTGHSQPLDEVFPSHERRALYLDLIIQRVIIGYGAGLAALIACLGLFALSVHTAERRTKEIGVRKVLGAGRRDIVLLLVWQFTLPVMAATAVAIPASFLAMDWWLHGFAYHITLSAWIFAAAAMAAVVIAWLTVSWQSFMVARAKPVSALRYE